MPVIWVRQDKPPFNDERVREALDIGIDRDDYIEKIDFGEGRYNGVLTWTIDFWALPQDELREILKYDPDKAKQLLSAAGHSDGFEIRAPTRNDGNAIQATSVVAEHYSKLGVKVNIQAQEVGVWLVALFSSDFDITLSGTLSIWEPDYCLSFYYSGTEDDPNFTGINDPQIDSLIEGSWAIMGREERRDHLLEVQRDLLKKHGPVYQLSSPEAYVACNSKLNGVYPPAGVLYWSGTEYWVNES